MTDSPIILNNTIYLPKVSKDQYSCWEDVLSVDLSMINGRMVTEERGRVWKASYSYDYMGNDLMRQVLAVLRTAGAFPASVLPDDRDTMISSRFITEALSHPQLAFTRNGKPYWHKFSFTIREEEPHG